MIVGDDFEIMAREHLYNTLKQKSKGNVDANISGYMSHIRRLRKFIFSDADVQPNTKISEPLPNTYKNKTQINMPTPSVNEVNKYLNLWNTLESYHLQENALDKLFFALAPHNTNISDILLKAATLNDFYSTNIFSIFPVAKHILSLNIDKRLKGGDENLVDEIKNVTINDTQKQFYSFATKYCSHHNPNDFPIYDSYVDKVLCHFRNKDNFSIFNNNDLKTYSIFKQVLCDFQKFYKLEEVSLKELDKYLWQLGKEYFPNTYYSKSKNK